MGNGRQGSLQTHELRPAPNKPGVTLYGHSAVRWTGQVIPAASPATTYYETYTFYTQNDDGVRLWVNNQLLIDDWRDHALTEHAAPINLRAGQPVSIRLDYYEHHGQAAVKLLWSSPSMSKQIIPASQLLPPR